MHLIRLDGGGPAGQDLYFHPKLTVLLGAPSDVVAAVVDAVRALADPTVAAPAGLVEVDRTLGPIRQQVPEGGPEPFLELRADRRPPPLPGGSRIGPSVGGPDRADGGASGPVTGDPGATARRTAAERIGELRAELDFVEGELRVARELEQLSQAAPVLDPTSRSELEAAADQLSLALLQVEPGGRSTEIETRLRALVSAADDAAVRAEAVAWRIDEVSNELEGAAPEVDGYAAERSMLLAELEVLRAELVALDARGAVAPGERERRVELEARVAVLLAELGYEHYADLLLEEPSDGRSVRPDGAPRGRRDRVLEARRRLLRDELDRLRAELPGEVDGRAAQQERHRLQSEAAGVLGVPIDVVERLTVVELADLIRRRSGSTVGDGGLADAHARLLRCLVELGEAPPPGTGDPVEVLAVARALLADGRPASDPVGLQRRAAELRSQLADQERLLDVLVGATVDPDPTGLDRPGSGSVSGDLPVGVPLAGRLGGEGPAARALVHRVAELRAAPGLHRRPLVIVADDASTDLEVRVLEASEQLQCVLVCPVVSPSWRAIGEDAGRVVEW